MRLKTLTVFAIVLAALVAATALTVYINAPERRKGEMGEYLFSKLPVNKINSIIITGPKYGVSLTRKKGLWVVEDRFDYPADFSMIADLVRNLKNVTVGDEFEGSEEVLKRLALKEPDDKNASEAEKAIRLVMKDRKGKRLSGILFGKTRKPAAEGVYQPGQYVKLEGDSTIYLVDRSFPSLKRGQKDWLAHEIADVSRDDIKRIMCIRAKGKKVLFGFDRPKKGVDFKPMGTHSTKKASKFVLNRLAGALSYLRMEDVLDPSTDPLSVGLDLDVYLEYHLFNGMIYRVYPGSKCPESDKCYLKLGVDYKKPASVGKNVKGADSKNGDKKEEKSEGEGAVKSPEEWKLEAEKLNKRLSPWIYLISKGRHDAFTMDIKKVFE